MSLLRRIVPGGRSIRFYLLLSWVVPGLFVFFASSIVYLVFSWHEHSRRIDVIENQLSEKSVVVARRLSGEMLIGARGSPNAVSKYLESELALEKVSFSSAEPPCTLKPNSSGDFCFRRQGLSLQVYRKIPFLKESVYSLTQSEAPLFISSLQPSLLIWGLMPFLLLIGLGLFVQRRLLRDRVSDPIKSLVDTTTGEAQPRETWPREFREISDQLSRSFNEREEAVFGKLSRGVIHDIRTLLHSVLSAVDLVHESEQNPTLRDKRLQVLYKASQINLRKIRDIVDLTLDGSREIPIRKINADIINTLSDAIASNQSLANAKGVNILFEPKEHLRLPHDPVQCERVFTNLIKNGIEAFDDLKSAEIKTSKVVSIQILENQREEISIVIEDSGPGLTVSGDSAFQLLKSSKVHGSGLGLLVSKKIVEGHGAKISAGKSLRLAGAKFEITFPKSSEAGASL